MFRDDDWDWDEDMYDEYEDQGFGFCPDCGIAFTSDDSRPCGEGDIPALYQ